MVYVPTSLSALAWHSMSSCLRCPGHVQSVTRPAAASLTVLPPHSRLPRRPSRSHAHTYLPNVIPHIREGAIVCRRQRAVQAAERHVILTTGKTAQPQVGPQLGAGNAHLDRDGEL